MFLVPSFCLTYNDIKKTKLLRLNAKLGNFNPNAMSIVAQWSLKEDYVLSSELNRKNNPPNLPELAKEFVKTQRHCDYDSFNEWAKTKNTVYELKYLESESIFRCTCPYGLKWVFCKHSVGLMIKFAGLEIPETAMAVPLHEHRQRGRF